MIKNNKNTNNNIPFWWSVPLENLIEILKVNTTKGLSSHEIDQKRSFFGSNTLEEVKPTSVMDLIFESVKEPMIILLLSIAAISLLFGKAIEAIVMAFVVAAYVSVEFINKFRSDRTMTRLRELTQPETKVMREEKLIDIPTANIVVGDIVILTEGVRIPADLRLLESFGLVVNEASLTGESFPVQKNANASVEKHSPLAERKNSLFSGTVVLSGEGRGIVLAVGKESELGAIAHEVQAQRKEKTFIQEAMTKLAKTLAILAIIVSFVIPLIGFLRGQNAQNMILTWLALTFLMVPGQPPIIITMALALASFELSNKKLIVKRLRGVEVLGQTTAIVTDKTGTITENKMNVQSFVTLHGVTTNLDEDLRQKIALCLPSYSNDPTDVAIQQSIGSIKKELQYSSLQNFDENHPWRALFYQNPQMIMIAGQPERVIEGSTLLKDDKDKMLGKVLQATNEGRRVVAFAFKKGPSIQENEWTFLALAVLSDPVRKGVKEAIANLNKAHISTYMVTGDHPSTADRIAKEIGLDSALLTGSDLDKIDDRSLKVHLKDTKVVARITPTQKQRLVSLLKQEGECVAVIGDGINDAPAIKVANMGIAMGEIGTDLAKEAADLILTDDNYVHIPDAIAIGRKALDNFRKGLTYYLSAKAILLCIFLAPLALGIPFPFAPIHIILTELLMDLASSTIFVSESVEPNIMDEPSQKITNFLSKNVGLKILKNAVPLALGILLVYLWVYYSTSNISLAQTSAFITWLLGHILLALNLKQEKVPLFKQGITSNLFGFYWLLGMIVLSLTITTVPFFYSPLQTTALSWYVWTVVLVVSIASTFWIEVVKIGKLKANKPLMRDS